MSHFTGSSPQPRRPPRRSLDEALKAQPEWIRSELEQLRRHEGPVLAALEDPEKHALFLRDPAALLKALEIPVSGALRQRLRAEVSRAEAVRPVAFRLPGGDLLRPRVRVRFVKGREP
jgi:hypothetical protein